MQIFRWLELFGIFLHLLDVCVGKKCLPACPLSSSYLSQTSSVLSTQLNLIS